MDAELVTPLFSNKFLVGAIQQEIFSRIFPTIRHDVVSCLSPSLMRVSIIDRYLTKPQLQPDQLKVELKKIEAHLKEAIVDIRELRYLDFDVEHTDSISNILHKSIKFMESELAAKGIEFSTPDATNSTQVQTQPLLYTLLCLYCYIEDNDIESSKITFRYTSNTIMLEFSPTEFEKWDIDKTRNLKINRELLIYFAQQHHINITLNSNSFCLVLKSA